MLHVRSMIPRIETREDELASLDNDWNVPGTVNRLVEQVEQVKKLKVAQW